MEVRFYGRLAELIGRTANVEVGDGASIGAIRKSLAATHPAAAETLSRSRACIGDRVADDTQPIAGNASIEFLPPVSGG